MPELDVPPVAPTAPDSAEARIAVVIPCYRVKDQILGVIARIGPEVWRIYVVDDCCPQSTGEFVQRSVNDGRVRVLRHEVNQGVGGAVISGYCQALRDGADVMVKIDGDGQMDPRLLPRFVAPILAGEADYTKGNRFYDPSSLGAMPAMRLFGNAVLSFMAKVSTGYWNLFDPTNGYTAIDARVFSWLRPEALSKRYFFETDILFRLNTLRAVVADVPMDAVYGDEHSNLRISKVMFEFLWKHLRNASKRILYNYFLRDLSLASLELIVGSLLLAFGVVFGAVEWGAAIRASRAAPLGTIMLAALPVLLGTQMLLSFLGFDVASVPTRAAGRRLGRRSDVERTIGLSPR